MTRDIPVLVNELLRYRLATDKETEAFRNLGHNEHLCPRVRDQLELLLQSFVKYDAIAYDVQGIHDLGTDVLLKYYPEELEGGWEAIAFQVKSFDDMTRRGYLKDLRSQLLQAEDDYGDRLNQYVILLCTDANAHRDKLREVTKSFAKRDHVVVIVPNYAYNFLRLNRTHVSLVVDVFEKADDVVLAHAQETVGNLLPTRAAMMLSLVYHGLASREPVDEAAVFGDPFLHRIYSLVPDDEHLHLLEEEDARDQWAAILEAVIEDPEAVITRGIDERLRVDLDALVGDVLIMDHDEEIQLVNPAAARPLRALLLDLEVRYGIRGTELLEHAFGLLGVMRRFGLDYNRLVWSAPSFSSGDGV